MDGTSTAEKELQKFVSIVSHDFKAPIRHINDFSQLLSEGLGDRLTGDDKLYLEFIQSGAKRLNMMMDDLLVFSRIDTHGKPHEAIKIAPLLQDILLELEPLIQQQNAIIITDDATPDIHGDPVQIRLVFYHLIKNALLFQQPESDVKITIACAEEEGKTLFRVSDNGIGMREKSLEDVFHMFHRLHAQTEFGGGSGAGLAIVKRIIERHGGDISITSTIDQGSIVTFHCSAQP